MDQVISEVIKTQIELNSLQSKTIEFLQKRIAQLENRISQQSHLMAKMANELDLIKNYGVDK